MWFGLTGRNASGKTTVVDWLVENGYTSTSCSDSIRAHLRSNGIEINRDNLIEGERKLEPAHGPGILAEMLRDEHSQAPNLVIDSIRTPAEVEALQRRPDFRLIESVHLEKSVAATAITRACWRPNGLGYIRCTRGS